MIRTSLVAGLLLAPTLSLAQPAAKPPVCTDAAHHAFDFWIGRWTVTETKNGKPAGESLIETLYSGCTIRENWTEPGYAGGSLNTYDAVTGKWRQTWTDSAGTWREFVGGPEGGKMVLVWRHADPKVAGQTIQERMIFTPNADGSVRQYSDQTIDDGKTWTERYDYTYRKAS
jgi:hypothetical protein